MFAVIEVGGKQYLVKEGDILEVEKQDTLKGKELKLKNVLLASKNKDVQVGMPYLKDVSVEAKVIEHFKADNVVSYKYRRRKASHWKKGHRQQLTRLKIKEIIFS